MKFRIAVDFDGVIHQYVSGWKGMSVIADPPVPGAIEWLEELAKEYDVVIHTCRFTKEGSVGQGFGDQTDEDVLETVEAIKRWLSKYGLTRGVIEKLKFWTGPGKPHAVLYVDDRGFRFEGKFPKVSDIDEMRFPWNRPRRPEKASADAIRAGLAYRGFKASLELVEGWTDDVRERVWDWMQAEDSYGDNLVPDVVRSLGRMKRS